MTLLVRVLVLEDWEVLVTWMVTSTGVTEISFEAFEAFPSRGQLLLYLGRTVKKGASYWLPRLLGINAWPSRYWCLWVVILWVCEESQLAFTVA
jgi:hypothetical protein